MYFEKNLRNAVWAVSAVVGILVMLSPILFRLYVPTQPYLIPLSQKVNNAITFGFIIIFAFPAVVEFNNYQWIRKIERSIPRLLRDIAEAVRSGVILPKAIEETAKKDYGPLSKELERVMAMFVLGATWEEAVTSMTLRVKSGTVARLATILVEANQSGGKTSDIIEMSVELFSNLDEYKEEQLNNMKPYLYTIYASIAIFLAISFVVLKQFLFPLTASTSSSAASKGITMANVLSMDYYASILFWASIMESFFSGLIAGKIGDRSYSAGLRHSVFLSIIAIIFFNIAGMFW